MTQPSPEKSLPILAEGSGELIGWHDPDENRRWVRENKPRAAWSISA